MIYAHTITQSCMKTVMFEGGIYEKAGPWADKIDWRVAVRGIEWGGGLDGGKGRGGKKETPCAGPLTGAGNWGGSPPVWGPRRRNEHYMYTAITQTWNINIEASSRLLDTTSTEKGSYQYNKISKINTLRSVSPRTP